MKCVKFLIALLIIVSTAFTNVTAAEGIYLKVTSEDGLNLREGPSTNNLIIRTLNYSEIVRLVRDGENSGWVLVETADGRKGWIFQKYTEYVWSKALAMPHGYVTAKSGLNIREVPNIFGRRVRVAKENETLVIFNRVGAWYEICDGFGKHGFVYSEYVEVAPSPTLEPYMITNATAVVSEELNLREGPGTKHKVKKVLKPGTKLLILEDDASGWVKVSNSQTEGYVYAKYLIFTEGIQKVYGIGVTEYNPTEEGRTANIERAVKLLNGQCISAGEEVSLLKVLGPITKDGGYAEAPEFRRDANGSFQTVVGYGGGVCQVSTTLYQAIKHSISLGAEFKVTCREEHGKSVSYVPKGEDATISWDSGIDFGFKNNGSETVAIRADASDGILNVWLEKW